MFEWKVEDLKLLNDPMPLKRFSCENDVSREDKIAFVDLYEKGKLTRLLDLIEKFNKERNSLPQSNRSGYPKTVSFIAWVKRNGGADLIDVDYEYGNYKFMGIKRNLFTNTRSYYDTFDDLVNEAFHRELLACKRREETYFLEHDPYSVAKANLRKCIHEYSTSFGVRISLVSNGDINVVFSDERDDRRPITLDEINLLLAQYKKLDDYIKTLSSEVNIS